MYQDTIELLANVGRVKTDLLRDAPMAFVVGSILAGAYVGIGIVLIFSVGSPLDPALQKLSMGVSFGIALTLVVFAGSELFTGHTMYMVLSWLKRIVTITDLAKVWMVSWVFNLVGSVMLAGLFVVGSGGAPFGADVALLHQIASQKMNSPAIDLLARATLCNWLVCLALWTSARTSNDVAKAILIFWCLFAFIAAGFEHRRRQHDPVVDSAVQRAPRHDQRGRHGLQPVLGHPGQYSGRRSAGRHGLLVGIEREAAAICRRRGGQRRVNIRNPALSLPAVAIVLRWRRGRPGCSC